MIGHMKDILLILATLVTIGAVIPYILDVIKGKTKPNIVSWITWTLLTAVATVAEISAGEYRTAVQTAIRVASNLDAPKIIELPVLAPEVAQ